ncbi:MAG: DUF488 domain-containing protein [Aquificae bacterium]|nr:DUF488 domain-containing protein [Aquificota bacterium]
MVLYTVGYSDFFEEEKLINRLKNLGIKHVVDVRTFPYSKTFPQYDEAVFKKSLSKEEIRHSFLGDYIGGLTFKNHFKEGVSSLFDLLEDTNIKEGLNKLYKIAKKEKTVIMCAEKEPFNCHRLAISFLFKEKTPFEVVHIFSDKEETYTENINRFKEEHNLQNLDISDESLIKERLELLYRFKNKREEKFPEEKKNLELFK